MPTYDYRCSQCGNLEEVIQSMREYGANPAIPECCGHAMERHFSGAMGHAMFNAQHGDRHYDGMQATDGTPIDSRSKHREYMKRKGLTTIDDYTQTWAKAEKERQEYRSAAHSDRELRDTVARELYSKQR
jgi:putative FmdB family regulatory protein